MNVCEAIACLDRQIADPASGLPEDVFLFASRITPMVNVDLLVKDARGRTLLAWRDDPYSGAGWHIPGGIVRFKEKLEARIQKVAQHELGTDVSFNPQPIAIHQLMHPTRNTRGHFLSLLYLCSVPADFVLPNSGRTPEDAGYLVWHDVCPINLIRVHEVYRSYICTGTPFGALPLRP